MSDSVAASKLLARTAASALAKSTMVAMAPPWSAPVGPQASRRTGIRTSAVVAPGAGVENSRPSRSCSGMLNAARRVSSSPSAGVMLPEG